MSVYLDYNASAPIDPLVLDAMIDVYKNFYGNADSRTHSYGDAARNKVENSRKQVASLLNVKSDEVFFTSGATESNNIAIQGLKDYSLKTEKKHIITTSIEHKAILETMHFMEKEGYEVEYISPDSSGRIDADLLLSHVREDTLLVTVMHVNNETGIIQPVKKIGDQLKERNVLFHIDATQSCGKLVDEIRELNYDMLSFSAHKMMGPQGIGCLILRKKSYKLPPVTGIMYGGQQEHGIRPGTIPVALVVGLGKACELAEKNYKKANDHFKQIKSEVLNLLEQSGLIYRINGDINYSINNTLNISIDGLSSEALMISTKQYCGISNGSACTSKSYAPSYVLVAMGIPTEQIESSIRLSWGADTNKEEAIKNFAELIKIAGQMKI